jgi:hypothetical protein
MNRIPSNLLSVALTADSSTLCYELSRKLGTLYPGKHVFSTEARAFDLHEALERKLIHGQLCDRVHSVVDSRYDEADGVSEVAYNAVYEFDFGGEDFVGVVVTYQAGDCTETTTFLVGNSKKANLEVFRFVCERLGEGSGEVLVFERGAWHKDESLFTAIRKSSLETLVLRGSMKAAIVDDVRSFLASRSVYEKYRVPYKRGILLYGPPGNGKTHFLKGLLASIVAPCLYVRSLNGSHHNDHESLRRVFARARSVAPCLLVFEDLESVLNEHNRSFFLNELDGFAENTGIVVIATTNYPEQIDPAIIDRPSRFDRKYLFDLPTAEERLEFLLLWRDALETEMRPDEEALERIANSAQGFSFAYLKELTTSATMSWMLTRGSMSDTLQDVLQALKLESRKGKAPGSARGTRRVGLTPEA